PKKSLPGESPDDETGQTSLPFPPLPIGKIRDAVYSVIPRKLGDREYWSEWAESVAPIAGRLITRVGELIKQPEARTAFDEFVTGLRDNINPYVSEDEAVEMLVQHIITRPVFDTLFGEYDFVKNNPVAKSMQSALDIIDQHSIAIETESLEKFYSNVSARLKFAQTDKEKQEAIRNLYDTFFQKAFPLMAERLGIAYTPVPVVDFILQSANEAMKRHLKSSLTSKDVHIIDPFTGTGTFITRLLQSGLIANADLPRKYAHEIHANEIVLLAYYIAAFNIETSYHAITGDYRPFEKIVFTDSFQMHEKRDMIEAVVLPENSERVNRQKQLPIRVFISNPPYSAGQKSENDDNKNIKYPNLDEKIRKTYAELGTAALKRNLYDSYVRAIRHASNRIGDKGVVAFITNASFIDSNTTDGLRKTLMKEFSHFYVFNLRGNIRAFDKSEGGGIFGQKSMVPTAISIMVKNPDHKGECELRYYDIGESLSTEEKLSRITKLGSIAGIEKWQPITPNTEGDWINQRDPAFDSYIPLGDKRKGSDTIFNTYSLGVATSRDAWVYNSSHKRLTKNMQKLTENYNAERKKYAEACEDKTTSPRLEDVVNNNSLYINWSRALKKEARNNREHKFNADKIVQSMYRPFTKEWLYFDPTRAFNEEVYQIPRLFPTPNHNNIVISISGRGETTPFSVLAINSVPNYHLIPSGQCFPLYYYEKADTAKGTLVKETTAPDQHGYIRHDAITDWALKHFRDHYKDNAISKDDIFWYVYGILHSEDYRTRFAANLKKVLPRVPLADDFWAFSKPGRTLGDFHLNYETAEAFDLKLEESDLGLSDDRYKVKKMMFGVKDKQKDKTTIIYNDYLTLRGIPLEAYNYIVNGKSAIEWLIDRYQIRVDKASQIENDPNHWAAEKGDPHYIINLIKRIVHISVESARIIKSLPDLPPPKSS
ncbi:MAG: N-6 DNA methylase, partial [Proteobacteria bacterium]|nr:N-6 DNA methylase [Pseudomonadota bacterium]